MKNGSNNLSKIYSLVHHSTRDMKLIKEITWYHTSSYPYAVSVKVDNIAWGE